MIQNKLSSATGISVGLATFMEYLPGIMGALASLAAIVWIGIQAYYFIKEKQRAGK